MPLSPTELNQVSARALDLQTMGFTRAEARPILDNEFSVQMTDAEYGEVGQLVRQTLAVHEPDQDEFKSDLNQYLRRLDYVQGVALSTFQNMIQHFNAQMDGQVEIEDPDSGDLKPVVPIKPMDLVGMGEKILKLDQDRLSAKLNFPIAVEKTERASGAISDVPQLQEDPMARLASSVEEDEESGDPEDFAIDAEFRDAD